MRTEFNRIATGGRKASHAEVIVLGGAAAIEKPAEDAGFDVTVPFKAGRVDGTAAQTDAASFGVLELAVDGFRNYYGADNQLSPAEALVDKAAMLKLTVPEMTVLLGGMRSLGASAGGAKHGLFTSKPGSLSN